MPIMMAGESGSDDGHSDDWAGATSTGIAVLVDGITDGGPTGCTHGTAWFVRQLGTRMLVLAGSPEVSLAAVLAEAIDDVAGSHGAGCDVAAPGAPTASVAMVRTAGDSVDYLVLSDAVAVVDTGSEPAVVTAGPGSVRAGHDPGVAAQAVTGSVRQPRAVVLLSRGAAVLAADFGAMTWRELVDVARERGPAELIAATREVERRDEARTVWPRPRTHEDATVVVHQL